ncbi:MAG: hypothetical protein K1X67_25185 [Fimbriimonadaceae bacterium]|nr:hypothetical protein [Fimbriimonadaceae bacterium]
MSEVFGRTNLHLPPVWIRLAVPERPTDGWLQNLVDAAIASKAPIDISTSPGLWGGMMRGTDATVICFGVDPTAFSSREIALNQTQAHVIEILSALGRPALDFYVVQITTAPEEFQIDAVLEALEDMRSDGLIRFFGLACRGRPLATLGTWQFHDAFEALFVPSAGNAYDTLAPLAQQRRVGVVTLGDVNQERPACRLLTISDAGQILRS